MSTETASAKGEVASCDENARNKLTRTLSRLIEESFLISDDTVLEKLFTHLTKQVEIEGKTRTTLQVYVLWLSLAERKWDTIQTRVRIFALKVAGLVCSSPAGFFLIQEKNIVMNIMCHLKNELDSAVVLAVINLLTELVKHQAGCNWILQTEVWRHIIQIYSTSQSVYVARAGSKFITMLTLAFETFDKVACRKVIEAVLNPLNIEKTTKPLPTKIEILRSLQLYVNPDGVPIVYKEMLPKEDGVPAQSDSQMCKKKPISKSVSQKDAICTLRLLCDILEGMLMSDMNTDRVMEVLMEYSLEMWAWEQVHNENKDAQLLKWLSVLLNFMNYLGTERTPAGEIRYKDLETLSISILRLTQTLLYKKQFSVVFEVCIHCQALRHKTIKGIIYPDEKTKSHSFDLENQLVVLQLMPTFTFLKRNCITPKAIENEIMNVFVDKLLSVSKHDTIRVCYLMSDILRGYSEDEVSAIAIQSFHYLMRTIEFIRREQAVIIFQTMMYTLKEFVPSEGSNLTDCCVVANPNAQCLVQQCPVMLMHILKCISTLIEKFRITWRESLETVCLLSFVQSLLANPNISPGLCVQSLKLVKQTIENFIPPNLALLVNTLEGSSIEILGSLLLQKLHDTNWEVRDSCLEVLQVIASLSEIKFPAFQNLILEPELLDTVVSMITTDQESYVRASAMTCLSELVKVQDLWENKLRSKQLIPVLMDVLSIETEGIVRREACCLITSIYKRQGVPECKLASLYETMFNAAVSDLHWEVKVYALTFWKEVISCQLANQGMIDGVFPSVTFSKQSRKIVTLDSAEIHLRLNKVMHELGKNGCLQVLWQCIQDECDVAVMRAAVGMTKELVDLLSQYSLTEKELAGPLVSPSTTCPPSNASNSSDKKDAYSPPGCEDICGELCKKKRRNTSSDGEPSPTCSSQKSFAPQDVASSSSSDSGCPASASSSEEKKQHMDDVINTILNDSDIDLLSPGYRHNVNFKNSGGGDKKCKKLMPNEFLQKIKTIDFVGMLNSRTQWLEHTSDNLDSLLDDILAVRIEDADTETNAVDCY